MRPEGVRLESISEHLQQEPAVTNKDEQARWPSGAPSRPNGRLGLGVLRHTSTTRPLL